VLSKFDEPKQMGKNFRVRCPAHDDNRPSLDIAEGDDGKVLFNCRSKGCTAEEICASMGIELRDLMPDRESEDGRRPPRRSPEAKKKPAKAFATAEEAIASAGYDRRFGKCHRRWLYVDANREPKGMVLRWDPPGEDKVIRQMRRDADGWRVEGMRDPKPLYRLPDLKSATRVIVTEGEPKNDVAWALGFVATTCAGGSQAASKTDWSPLAGKEVWILPDNDEPGRKFAADVKAILSKFPATKVEIVELPGLPEHGDLVDYVDAHDAVEPDALRQQIESLAAQAKKASAKPSRIEWVDAETFLAADYRPEWLIQRVLVKGQPGLIGGPSKGMKTGLMIDAALSLTTGRPFLGYEQFQIPHRLRVAIASGESGEATIQETMMRVMKARGITAKDLGKNLHLAFTLPTLSDVGAMAELEEQLAAMQADVVMVDPFYLCLGAAIDERSMFQMGPALKAITELIQRAGRTIQIAHHANGRLPIGEPMGLEHLAYAGSAQFARQWLLINRREKYANDGNHDLWLNVGGSVGHGGLWNVHIAEGITGADFGGRTWDVTVQTAAEARADVVGDREAKREAANREKIKKEQAKVLEAIDAEVSMGLAGATQKSLRTRTGFSTDKAKSTVAGLLEDGVIEPVDFEKEVGNNARISATGYRHRRYNHRHHQPTGTGHRRRHERPDRRSLAHA